MLNGNLTIDPGNVSTLKQPRKSLTSILTNLQRGAFVPRIWEKKTKTNPSYLHSDQGSEYTSSDYKSYVKSKEITISFADKASPWQNGFQESFYGKFKVDLGRMEQFKTTGELIEAIYQTMYYYNNKRRHTALNMSPV